MSINILKYESDIWKTADLLIGSGIKQSEFPKFMMPFFALVMVESRLVREAKKLKEQIGEVDVEDFIEMFELEGLVDRTDKVNHSQRMKVSIAKQVLKNDSSEYKFSN